MDLTQNSTNRNVSEYVLYIGMTIVFGSVTLYDYAHGFNTLEAKLLLFNVAGAILSMALLILLYKHRLRLNFVDLMLITFICGISINSWITIGFLNNYLLGIITSTFLYILIKGVIANSLNRELLIENLNIILLVISIAEGCIAAIQFFVIVLKHSDKNLLIGTLNNSGVLSIYLGSSFVYFLAIYLDGENKKIRKPFYRQLIGFYLLLVIMILPTAASRTALIGVVVISVVIFNLRYRPLEYIPSRFRKIIFFFIAILFSLASIYLYFLKKDSADGRVVIWKGAIQIVAKHPLNGIGFNQFQNKFPDYQAKYFNIHPSDGERFADKNDYVFNDYLQLLIENGIPSFIIFIVMIFFVLRSCSNLEYISGNLKAAFAGFAFLLSAAMTSYPFEIMSIWMNFLFFIVMISTLSSYQLGINMTGYKKILVYGLMWLTSLFVVIVQYRSYRAKETLAIARRQFSAGNLDAALQNYNRALHYAPYEKAIGLEAGKCYQLLGDSKKCIATLEIAAEFISDPFLSSNLALAYQQDKNFAKSEEHFKASISMMPNRLYSRYLLCKMYLASGQKEKAINVAEYVLKMPVKVESEATIEIKKQISEILKSELYNETNK